MGTNASLYLPAGLRPRRVANAVAQLCDLPEPDLHNRSVQCIIDYREGELRPHKHDDGKSGTVAVMPWQADFCWMEFQSPLMRERQSFMVDQAATDPDDKPALELCARSHPFYIALFDRLLHVWGGALVTHDQGRGTVVQSDGIADPNDDTWSAPMLMTPLTREDLERWSPLAAYPFNPDHLA